LVHRRIRSSVDCRVGWTGVLCKPLRCLGETPDFNVSWS